MFKRLLDYLFGCSHPVTTFPQTNKAGRTHVSCLTCGRELAYSWEEMRIVSTAHLGTAQDEFVIDWPIQY